MNSSTYHAQVELVLKVLPYVAKESVFALKGGTAINLFERDMPRMSVDTDLTYLPFRERSTALKDISGALRRIQNDLSQSITGVQAQVLSQGDGQEAKLQCRLRNGIQIKIEVNTIMRGFLQKPRLMQVVDAVQDTFRLSAIINVVAQGELYGGKICAALDRQHPRDLFDIKQRFQNEGLTDEIRLGFVAALAGCGCPMHEMLRPNRRDQRMAFQNRFNGMTFEPFSYRDFVEVREKLIHEVNSMLTDTDKAFLISLKSGAPIWKLYPIAGLDRLAAVQWKLRNIHTLKKKDPSKHAEQLRKLEVCLS